MVLNAPHSSLLGPGLPLPRTGAAEQALPDLPGRDPAGRVRLQHERDAGRMTAGQSHAPLPGAAAADPAAASHEGTTPPRDADRGPVGSPRGRRKTLKTGPSNWLLVPALSFFGVFALLPLAGVVALSFFACDGLGTPQFASAWFQVFRPGDAQRHAADAAADGASYAVQFPLSLLGTSWRGTSAIAKCFRSLLPAAAVLRGGRGHRLQGAAGPELRSPAPSV